MPYYRSLISSVCGHSDSSLDVDTGWVQYPSSTNFLIFRTPLEASSLEAALAARGVLVRDVSGYEGLDGYVRVNAGIPSENKAFLLALNDVIFSVGNV